MGPESPRAGLPGRGRADYEKRSPLMEQLLSVAMSKQRATSNKTWASPARAIPVARTTSLHQDWSDFPKARPERLSPHGAIATSFPRGTRSFRSQRADGLDRAVQRFRVIQVQDRSVLRGTFPLVPQPPD